jgi:hypothetical protein
VSEAKERDGRRQAIADLFAIWWEKHHDQPIAVRPAGGHWRKDRRFTPSRTL